MKFTIMNFIISALLIVYGNCAEVEEDRCGSGQCPKVGPFSLQLDEAFVHTDGDLCSTKNGCLNLNSTIANEGSDILGPYNEIVHTYTTTSLVTVEFSVRNYSDGVTIFKQFFPEGLSGTSMGDKDDVSTGWPVFSLVNSVNNSTDLSLMQFITLGGYHNGWTLYAQGNMVADINRFRDGESGGVIVLVSNDTTSTSSIILSAITEPMAINFRLDRDSNPYQIKAGIQGLVDGIPAGYTVEIVVREATDSIYQNVMGWGKTQQTYHESIKLDDFMVDYLGYWTDNGASHYYNPLPYNNFEDTIMNIYNYSVDNEIPFRYVQLDSWWYYKGEEGGVKNWTAKPSIFPNGIEYINQMTGWPILAHNRYFSNDTDYAEQNGGSYPFTIDLNSSKALPLDKSFWDDLFDEGLSWGLSVYEQDWLDRQYEGTSALHTNITLGSYWLDSMAHSATERGLRLQYCMSFPRHFLHSVKHPAITQIRVSDDYVLAPDQWRIGATSLFAHALGLKPYKDVFWSSRENVNVVFNDCEVVAPYDLDHPLKLRHEYGGRQNVTKFGDSCLYWKDFGWDAKYPHSGMRENVCRNPEQLKRDAFCYTKASFESAESEWEFDFCNPPVCQLDCYVFNGIDYIGSHNVTQSGAPCVDWNGEYGINGSKCRNPTHEYAPWCYTTEDHSQKDYCDNKCEEYIEYNPDLHAAISTLSTGPVGVGDRAENLDKTLIMKSCRPDGLLLKPSVPLTAIDLSFLSTEEIWTSSSTISGSNYGIIFQSEIDIPHIFTPQDLHLEEVFTAPTLLWQNYPNPLSNLFILPSSISLPSCRGYYNFCLWYISPIYDTINSQISLLGEAAKWAVVSPQRITNIIADGSNLIVNVGGLDGENVTMNFWSEVDGLFSISCIFADDSEMTLDAVARTCTPI